MRKLEETFKALGDRTRLRIMSILLNQELCVCEIVEALKIPQPRISRHLGILKTAGLVIDRREGQMVYYRLNSGERTVDRLAPTLAGLFNQQTVQEDLASLKVVLASRVDNMCCPNEPRTNGCCGKSNPK